MPSVAIASPLSLWPVSLQWRSQSMDRHRRAAATDATEELLSFLLQRQLSSALHQARQVEVAGERLHPTLHGGRAQRAGGLERLQQGSLDHRVVPAGQ